MKYTVYRVVNVLKHCLKQCFITICNTVLKQFEILFYNNVLKHCFKLL